MESLRHPDPGAEPIPIEPDREARGLFAAGWYATRDEGRLVHPAEQTEQFVSAATWRMLRQLETMDGIQPIVPSV
ncbi:hypothetical protein PE066_02085 [Ramlibacter tataouinensis]|uniref:hypothetical protein n=1 Tax=Ramlibacter tataouinensis TaxID=94132 RepID=UPI0022F3E602|nr:hypothetical protein [Ramlibacter tataouinensis]WBY02344.1 hypothetical protein PE066_02085 [Ramlibacter tataouinensis]